MGRHRAADPKTPPVENLIAAREAAGVVDDGVFNTVTELIALRRNGYLIGGEAEGTPRDWTSDESALLKRAYRSGSEHAHDIREFFSGEADEVDRESPEDRATMLRG